LRFAFRGTVSPELFGEDQGEREHERESASMTCAFQMISKWRVNFFIIGILGHKALTIASENLNYMGDIHGIRQHYSATRRDMSRGLEVGAYTDSVCIHKGAYSEARATMSAKEVSPPMHAGATRTTP
jgi:hypothetical protein